MERFFLTKKLKGSLRLHETLSQNNRKINSKLNLPVEDISLNYLLRYKLHQVNTLFFESKIPKDAPSSVKESFKANFNMYQIFICSLYRDF